MDIVSNYPLNDYPYTHRLAWLSAHTRGFLVQWMVVNIETHSFSKCRQSVSDTISYKCNICINNPPKPQGPVQKRGQEGCKGREVMEDQSGTVPFEHDRPLHSGTHSSCGGTRPALDQANHHSTKEEGGAFGPTPNRGAVGSPGDGFFTQRTSFL